MTNINWGPEIAVEGKRPEWLAGHELLPYIREGRPTQHVWRADDPTKKWECIQTIRLPADHPHYSAKGLDTTDTLLQPVDWSAPIEAVHEDGRVVPMIFGHFDRSGDPVTTDSPAPQSNVHWKKDGQDWCVRSGWRIRNVAQPAHKPRTAPSGGEVGPEVVDVHDLREARRKDALLWDRMESLCRSMTHGLTETGGVYPSLSSMDHYHEARAIVALLPEEVDTDLIEAREAVICAMPDQGSLWADAVRAGQMDDGNMVRIALIARRRSLEKGEAA